MFLVDKILQAVVQEGTGRGLRRWLSRDLGIAGKTGTTNGLRDSWFAGFSGNRLAVVWVGRDDNGPTGLTGATGALQIFGRTLSQISNTPLVLTPPENIEWAVVDAEKPVSPGTGTHPMPWLCLLSWGLHLKRCCLQRIRPVGLIVLTSLLIGPVPLPVSQPVPIPVPADQNLWITHRARKKNHAISLTG